MERKSALESAKLFVDRYFPNCCAAILGGSVARNEATSTSDLDIVIIDDTIEQSYRESLIAFGWPIEVFVHHDTSYSSFFSMDAAIGRPTLPRIVAEGIIIRDHEIVSVMQAEAKEIVAKGPADWSDETIKIQRYTLTDLVDDFVGAITREETICIALSLATTLQEFYLRINNQWVGESKWIYRELKSYDPDFAEHYINVLERFYRKGEKQPLIDLVDEVLMPHGGRLFEGFSLGKE
ncbi:nucleotidyltransferase domain-containing protein [Paraliobacillus salinarum]|uniref:nucleotidyltransferase domain-containing protein n=1 Tax=Paraliobacillus salinarum TaxID=1158996 RepID=UPI0015F46E55|nr:nucleotidyltransferase domain-containing protein [Paraliobacillus salinarum]